MRSYMLVVPFFLAVSLGICSAQDSCAIYSNPLIGPFNVAPTDATDHIAPGYHAMLNEVTASAKYSNGPGPCDLVCSATSFTQATETGKLTKPLVTHKTTSNDDSETAVVSGTSATVTATGAAGVLECIVCPPFAVTIGAGGSSVSFSAPPLKSWKQSTPITCPARTGKTCTNCCSHNTTGASGGYPVCGPSPILIDTRHQGWHLTNPNQPESSPGGGYVTFRFGKELRKVSWPDWRYDNAWLVYDSRGVVDGADDLFGNYTAHANADFMGVKNHPSPNGWLALAFYDWPAQGGNVDGVIDRKDAIWRKLKLWKPKHCHLDPEKPCVALDSELFPLDAEGIHSLSLVYQATTEVDKASGSQCSFTALVNPDQGERQKSKDGRLACDFNLAVRK